MTRILGIDPGTRVLGYGIVVRRSSPRGLEFEYLECGVVRTPASAAMVDRLGVIGRTLAEIIAELRPEEVAIEKAFHGRNAASALKLGQARGAIMLLAAQHALPLWEYAPSQIKQVVVGHGRATKHDVQQRVRMLLRLRKEPSSDAADALAIALCHGTRGPSLTPVPVVPSRLRKPSKSGKQPSTGKATP